MSNSNGKITAPVSIDNDIAPVLGAPVNSNLGQLCTYSTINPYSKFKPVKSSIPFVSNNPKQSYWYRSEVFSTEPCGLKLTIYDVDSGNLDRSDSLEGCFEKWKDKYQPPIGYPYRALDFDGYNHKAATPNATVEKRGWTDTPSGTDVRIGETDTDAQFNVKVTLPEIPVWLFNHPENTGVITINFGVFGSSDFKEEIGRFDVTAACNNNPDTYLTNYANKTITIPCRQTKNLPSRGYSNTFKYYVLVSNSYIENIDFLSFNANLYRVKVPSPNYPEDYDYRIPINWFSPASPSTVPYTKIGNLDYNGYSYIRIENIRNLMTGNDLVIKYRTRNKPFTTAITLTIGNEWQTARDIAWYISPTNGGNGWTLVFKRPIGANDPITELAIAGERSIGY